jgi:hypothetical protein
MRWQCRTIARRSAGRLRQGRRAASAPHHIAHKAAPPEGLHHAVIVRHTPRRSRVKLDCRLTRGLSRWAFQTLGRTANSPTGRQPLEDLNVCRCATRSDRDLGSRRTYAAHARRGLRGAQHRRRNSTLGAVFTKWLLLALFMEPRMTKACRRPRPGRFFASNLNGPDRLRLARELRQRG